MTIKQQGGIFGRNPTFNDVEVEGTLTASGTISLPNDSVSGDAINGGDATLDNLTIDNAGLIQLTKNTSAQGDSLGIVEFHDEDGAAGADAGKFQLQAFRGGDKDAPTFKLIGSDSVGTLTDRLEVGSTGDVTISNGNLVINTSGKGIDFGSNTVVDVNNGVPVSKTVGSSTDVAHITTSAGGFTNFIFEVYAFSIGNNRPAKATILARGYSAGWDSVEIKDEQLATAPRVDLGVSSSGADLIISATQTNSSTLTLFIKSIYKTNVSITAA